jgi:hypothetical protein
MDREARNDWENFCALAEIEEDPYKLLEIRRNIVRILDEEETRLGRLRPTARVHYPTSPSNVA